MTTCKTRKSSHVFVCTRIIDLTKIALTKRSTASCMCALLFFLRYLKLPFSRIPLHRTLFTITIFTIHFKHRKLLCIRVYKYIYLLCVLNREQSKNDETNSYFDPYGFYYIVVVLVECPRWGIVQVSGPKTS